MPYPYIYTLTACVDTFYCGGAQCLYVKKVIGLVFKYNKEKDNEEYCNIRSTGFR